uniref:protein LNK2 isoform X2 n=1 Tax=Erigeron canadensis TaxID=72917 RepID=UPI001CB98927|nr:protein LNK2 isoform X2 [Erigeron canadensis]
MFDWEDQELANIVWGETGENEGHIVPPYEEGNEVFEEKAAIVKLTEKSTLSVTDSHEESYTHNGKASANGFVSLPNLSPSNATKLNLEHTDDKAQVDSSFQNLDSQSVDRDGSDFVDYGWANVGSFDDLDRILSNNNLVLWASSSDEVLGCSGKSELLSIESPSSRLGVSKGDCQHVGTESLVNEEKKMDKSASDTIRRNPPFVYPNGAINVSLPNEMAVSKHATMSAQIKPIRCQGQPPTSCDPWFSLHNQGKEFDRQHRQLIRSSSSKTTLQENSLPFPPDYNMMGNQHTAVLTLSHQQASSSSSYLLDKVPNIPLTPLSMTPQEKIEKLRRRQKMWAFLAIRKQQQKFSHEESQMQFTRAGNVEIDESLGTCMSLDVSSPLEQSDSDTRTVMLDKSTLEDNILHQLQNVIATLGIDIRLCIRDSLFRLAGSAFQRKNYGDTVTASRINTDESIEEGSSSKSLTKMHDGETKTNPIDRAVAQLLFHTPPES